QRSDRRGVAARRVQVARDLFVVLQTRAGVDDRVVHPRSALLEGVDDTLGRKLRPATRPPDSRQYPEAAVRALVPLPDALELLERETVRPGQPARRGKARSLV